MRKLVLNYRISEILKLRQYSSSLFYTFTEACFHKDGYNKDLVCEWKIDADTDKAKKKDRPGMSERLEELALGKKAVNVRGRDFICWEVNDIDFSHNSLTLQKYSRFEVRMTVNRWIFFIERKQKLDWYFTLQVVVLRFCIRT